MAEPIEIGLRLARPGFRLEVALRLPGSGVSAVFGPSGSGKSTLLRALAGLEPDARGRLRIGGETWQDGDRALPPHRRRVGVVFQQAALLPQHSVEANLRYGWRRANAPAERLAQWVERLGLGPLLARAPATLSGGERQRVALARALVTDPCWLLLDEPLSALDAERRGEILPLLEAVRAHAGIPILYVSHAIEEVARLADHLVLLEAGRVLAAGPALELFNRADLPLALREDAGVVLDAVIRERDPYGLSTLETAAGVLYAHGPIRTVGDRVRLRIQARDVSISLARHDDTSLLNLLPATVESLQALPGGQLQLRLHAGSEVLLARVAARSVARLHLEPGRQVWAQVKAVALLA